MSTNLKDPNFEFPPTPLLPHLPKAQISSSALYIQRSIFKYILPMFLPECERSIFRII